MYTEMALTARRFALTLAVAGIAAMGSVALAPAASAAPGAGRPVTVVENDKGNGPDQFLVCEHGKKPVFFCDATGKDDKQRREVQATGSAHSTLTGPVPLLSRSTARPHTGSTHRRCSRILGSTAGVRPGWGQPSRAAWNAANFAWVSASSAAGSEPATMPQPANSRAPLSPVSSAQRSASPNSPSPRESSQPTGPA